MEQLLSVSPIDGRYYNQTKNLSNFFSEFAYNKWRLFVEVEWFLFLIQKQIITNTKLDDEQYMKIKNIPQNFTIEDCAVIKQIEKEINHDVKAIEYFLKSRIKSLGHEDLVEFVHFGLTSQDVNNTAIPLMLKKFQQNHYQIDLMKLIDKIEDIGNELINQPILSRTHGQPASPTRFGKEILVFHERLTNAFKHLTQKQYFCKFGGAVGNFNAHLVAYPDLDWKKLGDEFVKSFGLTRQQTTTQIEHYDNLCAIFDDVKRINTILIDFTRDMWQYISMDYFKQSLNQNEVGSSAMPHKVNPIDFENAEGNLGLANALLSHFSEKLPISRLQRDLTDSTVIRNIGVPFAHTQISIHSILRGLNKLGVNPDKINKDLDDNWQVIAEGIQTVLRRESFEKPYEALKGLTRGNDKIGKSEIWDFIDSLDVTEKIKKELKEITPFNYLGV